MKKIFVIDWILVFVFVLSAFSGIGLHIAGHGNSHEVWHNWAVFHVLTSFLFFVAAIFHITTHWGWYKGIIKYGLGKKSKITVVLSVVFLLVSVTGIILLGVNGANSDIGLLHYEIGIATIILCVGHILKRIHLLRKSLK
ncbi:DUF4405 domain-containing protein [Phocaeicola sartorii]|uniref:DUF4405 domain-containing protein n=1 Tax=Phocaeicola sartorii TaxID=671267 RepID=UPI001363D201|nr:DUF4405 domain-containing protein [Phocaeicola sartorii]NBH65770.1 DUF4405 domain-containing protein [Phocaeicola sartorii]